MTQFIELTNRVGDKTLLNINNIASVENVSTGCKITFWTEKENLKTVIFQEVYDEVVNRIGIVKNG